MPTDKTGLPPTVEEVCNLLEDAYGSPRHGNPEDPLDDLIFVILSNRTGPLVAQRVFSELKDAVGHWRDLSVMSQETLSNILRPAGLASKRAAQLTQIVKRLMDDFGDASLDTLAHWSDDEAERYLASLPGVSLKVAKCVLMYALGRQVLPVDVHVHRISARLGWHRHKRADQAHETLERLVPPHLRYGFHVNCLAHGRSVCRASRPRCSECVLASHCSFALNDESLHDYD